MIVGCSLNISTCNASRKRGLEGGGEEEGHCSDCMVACVIEKGVNICFKQ